VRVIGHAYAVSALERYLPPVVLLSGPRGVGKSTLAEHLVAFYGVRPHDVTRVSHLDTAAARSVRKFCTTKPRGDLKAVLADITSAAPGPLNSLLKVLEEPPPGVHFILWSHSAANLLTVTSRAQVYWLGYLSVDQVNEVLTSVLAMDPLAASVAAKASRGSVDTALAHERVRESRGAILTVLRAVSTHDEDLLRNGLGKFGDAELALLIMWGVEARTKAWQVFTPEESFGLADSVRLDDVLTILTSGARPKIAARIALNYLMEFP
jgi:energy-coupling factor transporter ATP-binding protein EcfA2